MLTTTQGPDSTIPRDRWGRPLIAAAPDAELLPYVRASQLGKALADGAGLRVWHARLVARGVAASPALSAAIATCPPGDDRALDGIIEQATARVGMNDAATLGTAIHAACEHHDAGQPLSGLPDPVRTAVERYARLLDAHELTPLPAWSELFLVDDDLRAAGSADRFYRDRDGVVVVGDLKTGKGSSARYAAVEWSVQCAVYAHGVPYRSGGVRGQRHRDLNPDAGVVLHVPSDGGEPCVHDLDLRVGYRLAQTAAQVLSARKLRPLATRETP